MSQNTLTLPEAARHFGVSLRALRHAIRTGAIPAPQTMGATIALPAGWLTSVKAAIAATPHGFSWTLPQKVPAFARYQGTSAWRKYTNRVNEYTRFRAAMAA